MAIGKVLPKAVHNQDLAFDNHALLSMAKRKVSEEQVIETLEQPDEADLPADEGRKRCRKFFHQGTTRVRIDVVYEEEVTRIVVFTVWQKEMVK